MLLFPWYSPAGLHTFAGSHHVRPGNTTWGCVIVLQFRNLFICNVKNVDCHQWGQPSAQMHQNKNLKSWGKLLLDLYIFILKTRTLPRPLKFCNAFLDDIFSICDWLSSLFCQWNCHSLQILVHVHCFDSDIKPYIFWCFMSIFHSLSFLCHCSNYSSSSLFDFLVNISCLDLLSYFFTWKKIIEKVRGL